MLQRVISFLCAVVFVSSAWAADKPIVLVAGASGETGIHIVRALTEKGYAVRGLVRDVAKAKSQNGEIAEWITGDVRNVAQLKQDFARATYAISAIGSREKDGPNNFENIDWLGNRNLIDAAKAVGVKHYVLVTSGSAGVDGADPKAQMFTGRYWKGKAEDYLRASGLTYTIIAPGGLRNFPGGEKGVLLRPRNLYTIGTIARIDVAAVIAECLANPSCNSKTMTAISTTATKPGEWTKTLPTLPVDTPDTIRGGMKAKAAEGFDR